MASASRAIDLAAKLAGGIVWVGTFVPGAKLALVATAGVLGIASIVTDGFAKFERDRSTTLDAIREKTREAAEGQVATLGEKFDLKDADEALATCLADCFLDTDALVNAAPTVPGFETRATELVMAALAAKHPDQFGDVRRNDTGVRYARAVVQAALASAIAPENFAKLQPKLELAAQQSLARLLAFNGDVAKWLVELNAKADALLKGQAQTDIKLDAGFESVLAKLNAMERLRLGFTEEQVRKLLIAFQQEQIPVEQAETQLLKAADELKGLRERLSHLSNVDEPEIAGKRAAARKAIDEADFIRADDLLAEVATADLEAGELRIRRGAEAFAERAALASAQAQFEKASEHYDQAARTILPYDTETAWRWWVDQAIVLQEHGRLFAGKSLFRAVDVLQNRCLPYVSREKRSADWAKVQNNLGNALQIIGGRRTGESSLSCVKDAIEVYRQALSVCSPADTPDLWALTQTNLGSALSVLGEQVAGEPGIVFQNEAVAAYRAALTVFSRASRPAQWASTQNNLIGSLVKLGATASLEEGPAVLREAVEACHEAMAVFTRESSPFRWATLQNNLGGVFAAILERSDFPAALAALENAVAAYRAALAVYTLQDTPIDWAMTNNNLAGALDMLGERIEGDGKIAALSEAVSHYGEALIVRTRDDMPAAWASTSENLSLAEARIAQVTSDADLLRGAIIRLDDVLDLYRSANSANGVEKVSRNKEALSRLLIRLDGT